MIANNEKNIDCQKTTPIKSLNNDLMPNANYDSMIIKIIQLEISKVVSLAEQTLLDAAELEIIKRKEFLTEKEVGMLYSISPASLRSERSRGLGPAYVKDGRRVLYPKKELENYFYKRLIKR